MCVTSVCWHDGIDQLTSENCAPWSTSTLASIPPSTAAKSTNWPPVSSCANTATFYWSVRLVSALCREPDYAGWCDIFLRTIGFRPGIVRRQ
jgi:hypothetical protein